MQIGCGCGFTSQSLKHQSINVESKHKLIGSGATGGYGDMKYLSDVSRATRTELSKVYTSPVVIDARVLLTIDTFLCKAMTKFLPSSFAARMKSQ